MRAAPGTRAFVLQEAESDSGPICATPASARGGVAERRESGVRVQDSLPPSCLRGPGSSPGRDCACPANAPCTGRSAWKEWLPCVPHSTMAPRSARSGSYVSLSCSIQALSVVCQCFLRLESRVENAPRTSCATPDLCGARAAGKAHAQAGQGRAFCHALLFKLTTHCDK